MLLCGRILLSEYGNPIGNIVRKPGWTVAFFQAAADSPCFVKLLKYHMEKWFRIGNLFFVLSIVPELQTDN